MERVQCFPPRENTTTRNARGQRHPVSSDRVQRKADPAGAGGSTLRQDIFYDFKKEANEIIYLLLGVNVLGF